MSLLEKKLITVTALNRYLKYRFDQDENLKDIRLKAEISNYKRHSRGHLYFSLKDENSSVNAVMFFQNASKLKFEPKEGSKVKVMRILTNEELVIALDTADIVANSELTTSLFISPSFT